MARRGVSVLLTLLLWLWCAPVTQASKLITPHNHAEWRWRTLETERFAFHYPTTAPGKPEVHAEQAARRLAAVADDLWLRMGDVLKWHPTERITVVVVDDSDALMAWSWPLRGAVIVSAHPGLELARQRSGGDLLMEVFAHELAHVFTHKRMGAVSEPAGFGLEQRGHAEVGPVTAGVVLPLTPRVPQWWSEGAAEYLAVRVGASWWSAERQTTVRLAHMHGDLLTWAELQVAVDKADPGDGERAYQIGHAFFRWLEDEFGPDLFAELHASAATRWRANPSRVLKHLVGESPESLYGRFVADMKADLIAEYAGRPDVTLSAPLYPDNTTGWQLFHQSHPDLNWEGEHRTGWIRVRGGDGDFIHERWFPSWFGSDFAFVPGQPSLVLSGKTPLEGPSGPKRAPRGSRGASRTLGEPFQDTKRTPRGCQECSKSAPRGPKRP